MQRELIQREYDRFNNHQNHEAEDTGQMTNYHALPLDKITEEQHSRQDESNYFTNSIQSSAEKRFPQSQQMSPNVFGPIEEASEMSVHNYQQSAEKPLNPSDPSDNKSFHIASEMEFENMFTAHHKKKLDDTFKNFAFSSEETDNNCSPDTAVTPSPPSKNIKWAYKPAPVAMAVSQKNRKAFGKPGVKKLDLNRFISRNNKAQTKSFKKRTLRRKDFFQQETRRSPIKAMHTQSSLFQSSKTIKHKT